MALVGALINGLEAALGSVLGLLFKGRVSDRLGDFLLKGQGLAVVLVAMQGMMRGGNVAIVTLSLALGSVVDLGIDIDARIRSLGDRASIASARPSLAPSALGTSPTGLSPQQSSPARGPWQSWGRSRAASRSTTQRSSRRASSTLQTMGIGVPFCGVSLVVYEGILSLLASLVGAFLSDAVVTEVAVTGSTPLLAVGINLLGVTDIKVANLIPAAFVPILLVPVAVALGLM